MVISGYTLDLISITCLFLTTLALQALIGTKHRQVRKGVDSALKMNILRNRMKNILMDDRAFEFRKSVKMAVKRDLESVREPLFITLNFR